MRRTREAIWTVESVSEKSLGEAEMWAIMVVRQFMLPRDSLSNMVSLLSLVVNDRHKGHKGSTGDQMCTSC